MPLEIAWEADGVVRRFYGTVSVSDLARSIEEVHADARFAMLRYSINDFTDVTAIDIARSAIASAALRTIGDSKSNSNIRLAIITSSAEVIELVQLYASPAYLPYPARIFSTTEEAHRWIRDSMEL